MSNNTKIFVASIIIPIILKLMHKGDGKLRKYCVILGAIASFNLFWVVISYPNITILGDLETLGTLLLSVMLFAIIGLIIWDIHAFLEWLEDF